MVQKWNGTETQTINLLTGPQTVALLLVDVVGCTFMVPYLLYTNGVASGWFCLGAAIFSAIASLGIAVADD